MFEFKRNKFFYIDVALTFGVWATLLRHDLSLVHIGLFSLTLIGSNIVAGIYKTPWQYFSFSDLEDIAGSFALSFAGGLAYNYLLKSDVMGFKFLLSSYIIAHTSLLFARFLWRWTYFKIYQHRKENDVGRNILCYGSGQEALSLMDFVLKGPFKKYNIVGYIDDNHHNKGKMIHHKMVLGVPEEIETIVKEHKITDIIVSNYHINVEKLKFILQESYKLGVKVTRMEENILPDDRSGIGSVVRDLNLEDLLDRSRTDVDLRDFQMEVSDKVVVVTGAGGSIGSEIAKQVTKNHAHKVYLIENSEYNLFKVMGEIKEEFPYQFSRVTPLLMDITNENEVERIFDEIQPDFVYHAAAYKHVHLLEQNPFNGIVNNVRGTFNLLKSSARNDIEKFVLISTDKAVAPTSVMGATKRICELLVSSYGKFTDHLYCSVRFGNVLGSSGSLIPILEEKIANNQSLTITDERMKRYFMLIPEAVSLVLKASMIADTGDICVLKMGKPIAIVDIARKLLLLRGKTEQEIPIIFTGAKPGEKLVEDLYLRGDEIDTSHEDIVVLPESRQDNFKDRVTDISFSVRRLLDLAFIRDKQAIALLWNIVEKDGKEVLDEEEANDKKAI